MAVYAPSSRYAERRVSPAALALIVACHAALLALVMTAKMDLPSRVFDPPIVVTTIPIPEPPPPVPPDPSTTPRSRSTVDQPVQIVPIPQPPAAIDPIPVPIPIDPSPGNAVDPMPPALPQPLPEPVRLGPRFITPTALVKPPYPESKRRMEEEAALRLRLRIDERGRVTSVEPVGRADAAFLSAARRHILAHWRYKPASEDGRAIAWTTVITLRFELD